VSTKRRTRSFWKRIVAEVDRGSTIAITAQRHGVSPKTLSWWRWTLRRDEERAAASTRFLPVVLGAEASPMLAPRPESITVAIRDDLAFRVPVGSDVGYVAALVAAVCKTC
jgi:transposase-like protein